MTTRDHTHDRPLVDWCSYWQLMAAKRTESGPPWWAVMAAKAREWLRPS